MEQEFDYYVLKDDWKDSEDLYYKGYYEGDMTTYHYQNYPNNGFPVFAKWDNNYRLHFSMKIYNALISMKIKGVKFYPMAVRKREEKYKDFWRMKVGNSIESLSKEKLVYNIDKEGFCYLAIKKLLVNIPLEKRLIIKPRANSKYALYHQSVVDAIMATNPDGVDFIKVSDWYSGTYKEVRTILWLIYCNVEYGEYVPISEFPEYYVKTIKNSNLEFDLAVAVPPITDVMADVFHFFHEINLAEDLEGEEGYEKIEEIFDDYNAFFPEENELNEEY